MRGGSKGVINKHLKKINGKPLLWYTINQAIKSKLFNKIIVSTDSNLISNSSIKYGVDKVFSRKKNQALDNTPKLPVIRDTFIKAELYYKTKFDILIDLDATSPLRNVKDIVNSYKQFMREKSENLITASISKKNPYYNVIEFKKDKLSVVKKLNRIPDSRQQTPDTFDMNASIYIWNRKAILKSVISDNKDVFLKKTSLYLMPEERSIDIDSPLDFKIVKYLIERNNNAKKSNTKTI